MGMYVSKFSAYSLAMDQGKKKVKDVPNCCKPGLSSDFIIDVASRLSYCGSRKKKMDVEAISLRNTVRAYRSVTTQYS
jgi:hypothetical protein